MLTLQVPWRLKFQLYLKPTVHPRIFWRGTSKCTNDTIKLKLVTDNRQFPIHTHTFAIKIERNDMRFTMAKGLNLIAHVYTIKHTSCAHVICNSQHCVWNEHLHASRCMQAVFIFLLFILLNLFTYYSRSFLWLSLAATKNRDFIKRKKKKTKNKNNSLPSMW